ncbi:hypothetical protein BCAR13_930026 [Paraburkholderia caribensis]|nr:hypothetical protein BCAR13_930026 [Paraburkholderia caribensis]
MAPQRVNVRDNAATGHAALGRTAYSGDASVRHSMVSYSNHATDVATRIFDRRFTA